MQQAEEADNSLAIVVYKFQQPNTPEQPKSSEPDVIISTANEPEIENINDRKLVIDIDGKKFQDEIVKKASEIMNQSLIVEMKNE